MLPAGAQPQPVIMYEAFKGCARPQLSFERLRLELGLLVDFVTGGRGVHLRCWLRAATVDTRLPTVGTWM